jgi:hypothetical protein
LPDDTPEFQPIGLTRADLVSNVMRDLVAREALSGVARRTHAGLSEHGIRDTL